MANTPLTLTDDELRAFKAWLARVASATDDMLAEALPRAHTGLPEDRLWECMRYSTFSGGKRLRPALVHGAARLVGGAPAAGVVRAAAAIEMIHVYSLMQDDLPCMDNDDLRHGVPTAHKKFDDVTALLASDGLQAAALELLADPATHDNAAVRCELIKLYAGAMGALGMVAGQMLDMVWEQAQKSATPPAIGQADLARLSHLKTGAIIRAATLAGALVGGADADARRALAGYASALGLAYQIYDDVLDTTGSTKNLGKTRGKDAAAGKRTFVTVLGLEAARKLAATEARAALSALAAYGDEADPLRWLARFAVTREV